MDCACASVAHQVSIECLCNIGYFGSEVLYRKLMRIMRKDALLTSDLAVIIWMTDLGLKKQTGLRCVMRRTYSGGPSRSRSL